jgi:hypothetical protein
MYQLQLNRLAAAAEKVCVRPPASQAVWICQNNAAGGASSSATMAIMFGSSFVFFMRSHNL